MRSLVLTTVLFVTGCPLGSPPKGDAAAGDAGVLPSVRDPDGDLDGDGVPNAQDPDVLDGDGDGVVDAVDLDADSDGVLNSSENQAGLDPIGDGDRDGVPNFLDADDRGDGLRNECADVNRDRICDRPAVLWDVDGDGIANHLDADSDADAVPDVTEVGFRRREKDGRLACQTSVGRNGLCDHVESAPESGELPWQGNLPDVDHDGWPDFLDRDTQQEAALPAGRLAAPGAGTSATVAPSDVLKVKFENSAVPILEARFENGTKEAGLLWPRALLAPAKELALMGGAAAQDLDGDGDIDLYLPRVDDMRGPLPGDIITPLPRSSLILWNDGRGRFTAEPHDARTAAPSSALLFDQDADGDLDLFVPSLEAARTQFFLDARDRGSRPRFLAVEVPVLAPAYSVSSADFDGDLRLDVFLTRGPLRDVRRDPFLLRNTGPGVFKDATSDAAVPILDRTLTGLWGDVDLDGWPDLLVTADRGFSRVLLNRGGSFERSPVTLTDENASGQALGDIDNDGDLDWFVSGVWVDERASLPREILQAGDVGIAGNRLLRNGGGGLFTDVTDQAGVRGGWWGWGACMADLSNDGYLDVVQVNGFGSGVFKTDPSAMWLNGGRQGFLRVGPETGFDERSEGRGILCADFDDDGDVDVLTINVGGELNFWRNVSPSRNWAEIDLRALPPNSFAVGAKAILKTASLTQYREVQAGSTYLSQAPYRLHFGLGRDDAGELTVIWPNGQRTTSRIMAGQRVTIHQTK